MYFPAPGSDLISDRRKTTFQTSHQQPSLEKVIHRSRAPSVSSSVLNSFQGKHPVFITYQMFKLKQQSSPLWVPGSSSVKGKEPCITLSLSCQIVVSSREMPCKVSYSQKVLCAGRQILSNQVWTWTTLPKRNLFI